MFKYLFKNFNFCIIRLSFLLFVCFYFHTTNVLFAEEFYSVEILASNYKEKAIEEAKKISNTTELYLDYRIRERIKNNSRILGPEITVYKLNDQFVITAYLGKNIEVASFVIDLINKYYSKKVIIKKVHISDKIEIRRGSAWQYRNLLLLGSKKEYKEAQQLARLISKNTNIPYTTRDLVYDPQKGLIFKSGGSYKVFNHGRCISIKVDKCITIEYSHAYKYLTPGYFIILGGLYQNSLAAKKDLALFRKFVPDAYLRKTIVYMGGM